MGNDVVFKWVLYLSMFDQRVNNVCWFWLIKYGLQEIAFCFCWCAGMGMRGKDLLTNCVGPISCWDLIIEFMRLDYYS